MGSLFQSQKTVSVSNLGAQQQGLHGPLRSLLTSQLGDKTDFNAFEDVLNQGSNNQAVRNLSDQLMSRFFPGHLEDNSFVDQTRLDQNLDSNFAQLLPKLIGLQLTSIGKRNELRLAPAAAAIRFATGNTRAPVSEPNGPGWGMLKSALSASTMLAGSGSFSTPTTPPAQMYTGRSYEDFNRIKGY